MSSSRYEMREAGSVIAGRYRVERTLAQGGMGEVLEATDAASGARVAVKVLRHDIVADKEAVARFRREGDILASLRHPNIVTVSTSGTTPDGGLYLVMELLEGETLGARMRREKQLAPAALVPIVLETASALGAAHAAGVVHRDLKPDNVFLWQQPDGTEQVKLLDFGVSKLAAEEERLTRTGELLGTPRYMAPEQVTGERDLDARVDIYSLGVILYEAIAGRPPFLGSTTGDLVVAILSGKAAPLRTLVPTIDPAIEGVVLRAISKAKDARHATATALAEAFAQATGVSTRPSMMGVPAPVARPGMGTLLLGGGEAPVSLPTPEPLGAPEPDALRPGTLSAFDAVAPIEAPALAAVPPTRMVPRASGGPEQAPALAPERRASGPQPLPRTGRPAPPPAGPGRDLSAKVQAMPAVDARAVLAAPRPSAAKRPRRSMLVPAALVGLLLGALVATAGVVVWMVRRKPAASRPPAPSAPAATSDAATGAAELPPPPVLPAPPTAPPAVIPAGVEPPPGPGSISRVPVSSTAPPSSAQGIGHPAPAPRVPAPSPRFADDRDPGAVPQPTPPSAQDPAAPARAPRETGPELMQAAREARRRGDPRACVTIAERAIAAGAPASASRLLGDCLMDAGDAGRAVAAYRRFCRMAPDHPGVAEVRAIVERHGGTCP